MVKAMIWVMSLTCSMIDDLRKCQPFSQMSDKQPVGRGSIQFRPQGRQGFGQGLGIRQMDQWAAVSWPTSSNAATTVLTVRLPIISGRLKRPCHRRHSGRSARGFFLLPEDRPACPPVPVKGQFFGNLCRCLGRPGPGETTAPHDGRRSSARSLPLGDAHLQAAIRVIHMVRMLVGTGNPPRR